MRDILRRIKGSIKPKLRKSGFCTGFPVENSRPLMLCVAKQNRTISIRGSKIIKTLIGFTEYGPITDVFANELKHLEMKIILDGKKTDLALRQ